MYFLITIGDEFQAAALTGDRYFHFALPLLFIYGLSFEIPLFIGALNVIGVLSYRSVNNQRRLIIMGIFIAAAVLTLGQEPYSMLILGVAPTILVDLTAILSPD